MTRRRDDTRTGELFDGPVVAGHELDPTHAIWLRDQAIPKTIKFVSMLEAGGLMPTALASQTRLGLMQGLRTLAGERDDQ